MKQVKLLILSITVVTYAHADAIEPQASSILVEQAAILNEDKAASFTGRRQTQSLDIPDTDTCFLCGQQPMQRRARTGRNQTVSFETCCSELDLSAQGNCTGVEEISRVIAFDQPFSRDVGDAGFFRITSINFTNSNLVQCCNTCSCNGNFCITFDNTVVSTLPCDARRIRKDCFGNGICAFDRDLCLQLEDPNGEDCIWDPEDPVLVADDFCPLEYEPQLLRLQNTPPCKPGSVVKTILLQLTPLVFVEQRRGLQISVLTVSSETDFDGYALVFEVEDGPTIRIESSDCLDETKLDCVGGVLVQHQQAFDEDEVTCLRERTVQNSGETVIDDWTIYYDSFAVPVEFSCQVSTLSIDTDDDDDDEEERNGNGGDFRRLQASRRNFTGSQLKLETISIPQQLEEAFEIGGICADPDLAAPIANSDSTCAADVASKPEEEVIAQAICQQESLVSDVTSSSFGLQDNPFLGFPCINTTFCSRFARPFFPSTDSCFDCFLVRRDVRFCFCNAVVRSSGSEAQRLREVQVCFDKVTRQGWKRTASEYLEQLSTFLPKPASDEREEGTCLRSFSQLNKTLGACEEGVLLEYYDVEFEVWRPLKAFPASVPFCRNADFTLSSSDTSPFALKLLRNTIRFRQAYRNECYRCKPRLGVQIGFDLSIPVPKTDKPTRSPTAQPTAYPTYSPTDSPTKSLRSTTPTVSKKGGWLGAWG